MPYSSSKARRHDAAPAPPLAISVPSMSKRIVVGSAPVIAPRIMHRQDLWRITAPSGRAARSLWWRRAHDRRARPRPRAGPPRDQHDPDAFDRCDREGGVGPPRHGHGHGAGRLRAVAALPAL